MFARPEFGYDKEVQRWALRDTPSFAGFDLQPLVDWIAGLAETAWLEGILEWLRNLFGGLDLETETPESEGWFGDGLSGFFEILLWSAVAMLLAGGLLLAYRRRKTWLRFAAVPPEPVAPTRTTMGDIRVPQPVTGPEASIPDQVWSLWSTGHADAALSLLYNAALAQLTHSRALDLDPAWTEADLLGRPRGSGHTRSVLSAVVRARTRMVYAHRKPKTARALCVMTGRARERHELLRFGGYPGLWRLCCPVARGLFLATHEQVTDTEPAGPSGRAVRDHLGRQPAAARMGVQTESRYGLGQLPSPSADTVIVVLANVTTTDWRCPSGWTGWPKAVPVSAAQPSTTNHFPSFNGESWDPGTPPDALEQMFGITSQQDPTPFWSVPTVMNVEHASSTADSSVDTLVTGARVHVGGPDCALVVAEGKPALPDAESPLRASLRARCPMGLGQVTVVSSVDLFHNEALKDHRADNAAFFWDTVAHDTTPTDAILVLRGDAPSFLALLWNRGWPAIIGLACTLLAWAAWQGQRFGPILDRPVIARRSMLEHLDASGSILWRHQRLGGLSRAMRAAVRVRLARRSPSLAHLNGDAFTQAVAELTGQPASIIHQALLAPPPTERRAFIEMMQTLQHLWRDTSPVSSGSST